MIRAVSCSGRYPPLLRSHEKEYSAPEKCKILATLPEDKSGWTFMTEYDIAQIDPVSIVVVSNNSSNVVSFSGTNYQAYGASMRAVRLVSDSKRGSGRCREGEDHCTPISLPLTTPEQIDFHDMESARRFARALFHASLCAAVQNQLAHSERKME